MKILCAAATMVVRLLGDGELLPEFLAVPGFMVLKPVKDVLAMNLAVQGEVGGDLLYLGRIWIRDSSVVQVLQYHALLWG